MVYTGGMMSEIDEVAREASLQYADQMIRFLNELVEIDGEAIHQLIEHRVPCNQGMLDHPTVQVAANEGADPGKVGLLGVLNGFIGKDTDGWGFICAMFDDDGKLLKFARTPPRKPKA